MARATSTGATLQQVADAAGVSLATASRVLHGSGGRRVSPALAERVSQAAAQLRYVAHAPAQSLARSRSTVVGLLVHDIADPYFAAIAAGAMSVARQHNLMVLVASTFRDPDLERDYLARLRAQRARAVVLAGSAFTEHSLDDELDAFLASGGRVATVGSHGGRGDAVAPSNEHGGHLAASHLFELGHTRVGVISGPAELTSVASRLAGFTSIYPRAVVVEGDFTRDAGSRGASALVGDVTAIFAMNDLMAAGAVSYLRKSDVDVPRDVAVIGFDDLPIATDVTPALTTIRLDLQAMGVSAMQLVLDDQPPGRTIIAPAELIIRKST